MVKFAKVFVKHVKHLLCGDQLVLRTSKSVGARGDVQSSTRANTSPANKGKLTQVKFVSTPLIATALSRELIKHSPAYSDPMNQKTIVLFQNTIVMIFCPIMSFQSKFIYSVKAKIDDIIQSQLL